MSKGYVRISVILVAIYLIFAYLIAQFLGIDILTGNHVLLFEFATVLYTFEHGKYHCKFMKWTMLSLFTSELLTRLDYSYDFLSVSQHNLIPIGIIALGITTSLTLALRHFYKVSKLKRKR